MSQSVFFTHILKGASDKRLKRAQITAALHASHQVLPEGFHQAPLALSHRVRVALLFLDPLQNEPLQNEHFANRVSNLPGFAAMILQTKIKSISR